MKSFWQVISLLSVIHVIAALGFVGYLAATNRINRDRLEQSAEIFRLTVAEQLQAEQQAQLEADAAADPASTDKLTDFMSTEQRLDADRRQQSIARQQIALARSDIQSRAQSVELAREQLQRQQLQFIERQRAFDQRVQEWQLARSDEGFKQAVALYEQLPPKQVKLMFNALIDDAADIDQVVQYLAAMQPRKASAVLSQFKQPSEARRAAELTERLRNAGTELASAREVNP
ncbi:MAG: hypothetical protein CMJ49_09380 [Planctomycetaceae bacterium]|nr:hypothetical protein [Planctomycetaceae bacterium]